MPCLLYSIQSIISTHKLFISEFSLLSPFANPRSVLVATSLLFTSAFLKLLMSENNRQKQNNLAQILVAKRKHENSNNVIYSPSPLGTAFYCLQRFAVWHDDLQHGNRWFSARF